MGSFGKLLGSFLLFASLFTTILPIVFIMGVIEGFIKTLVGSVEDVPGGISLMSEKIKEIVSKVIDITYKLGEFVGMMIALPLKYVFDWLSKKGIDLIIDIAEFMGRSIETLDKVLKAIERWQKIPGLGKIFGGQMGIPYVPATAPYLLHKGERVIPAGAMTSYGAKYFNINPTFQVTAYSELDIDDLGARLESQFMRKLTSDLRSL